MNSNQTDLLSTRYDALREVTTKYDVKITTTGLESLTGRRTPSPPGKLERCKVEFLRRARLRFATLDLPRAILAPMAGVTDGPFRNLAYRFGCSLAFSEMLLAHEVKNKRERTRVQLAGMDPDEPLVVQLLGREPEPMAEAARIVQGLGAAGVDINMGCPARKVVTGNGGAALMRDEVLAARIMDAVVGAVQTPVSVKMRLGWDDTEINAPRIAKIAEERGVKFLTVHARTRAQGMGGEVDWAKVADVTSSVSLPVIVNGDIATPADARAAIEASGASSVMIGRASLGAPWTPGRVERTLGSGALEFLAPPSFEERLDIMEDHFESLLSTYGSETGLKVSRKHMIWYARFLPDGLDWIRRYLKADSPQRARAVLRQAGGERSGRFGL